MKKILLAFGLLISTISFSQQEIKLDIADALIFKTVELSYEHYLSENSSVGISALFNFEGRGSDLRYNEQEVFTPFFRHYFTTENKWNMFGEAFLAVNTGEKEIKNNNSVVGYNTYTDGALGVAVGTKYISEGGLMIEVYGGLGRNLFTSDSHIILPRAGLNIGYRF